MDQSSQSSLSDVDDNIPLNEDEKDEDDYDEMEYILAPRDFDTTAMIKIRDKLLGVENKLFYDVYIEAVTICMGNLKLSEAQIFLHDTMQRAVSVLVEQGQGTLRKEQRDPTERCLILISKVLPHLLSSQTQYVGFYTDVVCKMLDEKSGLYRVQLEGTYYNKTIHLSYIRHKIAQIFYKGKGFDHILRYMRQVQWMGAYRLRVLLHAYNDIKSKDDMFILFRDFIANSVLNISEDVMKKENSDQLIGLFTQLSESGLPTCVLEYILKCFNSSSVVVKLAGWELVQGVVEDAFTCRPFGYQYEVRNAGYKTINGVYTLLEETFPADRGDVPKYKKLEGGKLPLMIFRAEMQHSHDKWWFISLPDREKPFTTNDIDFYQYVPPVRGSPDLKDPPVYGWQVSDRTKTTYLPAPTVVRLSDYIPPNRSKDSYLIYILKDWVLSHDILSFVFNKSLHREIISRSRRLMQLLVEMDAVNDEMIKTIWNAGYSSQEKDVTDEIFGMLGFLFYDLPPKIQLVLIAQATEVLNAKDDNSSSPSKSQTQVSLFLEQLVTEHVKHRKVNIAISCLSPEILSSLVSLVWQLFESEVFLQLKNNEKIELLLSICFKVGAATEESILARYIKRCVSSLSASSSSSSSSSVINCSISVIKQQIRCLRFLFLLLGGNDQVLTTLHGENFAAVLEDEFAKYIADNRELYSSGSLIAEEYSQEIRSRLSLFRTFYASSQLVEMDEALLLRLSKKHLSLDISVERDELFRFLTLLIESPDGFYTSASNESIYTLFKSVVCDPCLDWHRGTPAALETFREYFFFLHNLNPQSSHRRELIEQIALPTLWKMVLNAQEVSVRDQSMQFLMTVMNMLEEHAREAEGKLHVGGQEASNTPLLVVKVFEELKGILDSPDSMNEDRAASYVDRCIDILKNGIIRSRIRETSTPYFGAVGGNEREIFSIRAKWKCSLPYRASPYSISTYTSGHLEATEGYVDVHLNPYSTIYQLKKLIADQLEHKVTDLSRLTLELDHKVIKGFENEILKAYNLSSSTIIVLSYNKVDTYNHYNVSQNYVDNYGSSSSGGISVTLDSRVFFDGVEESICTDQHFNILIRLIDVISSKGAEVFDSVLYNIWDVLMRVPTNPTFYDMTSNFGAVSGNKEIFIDTFRKSSGHSTYLLRIVSNFLQPIASSSQSGTVESFKNGFLKNNGFAIVFDCFLSNENLDRPIQKLGMVTCLGLIHHLLFNTESADLAVRNKSFLVDNALKTVDRLLEVATFSSAEDNEMASVNVQQALAIIVLLLKTPNTSQFLQSNPRVKTLLSDVFMSPSASVRKSATDFAVEFGKSQPIVLEWLISDFSTLPHSSMFCNEMAQAMESLILQMFGDSNGTFKDTSVLMKLAQIISDKLCGDIANVHTSTNMMICLFNLQRLLVNVDVTVVEFTRFGSSMLAHLCEFLFSLPEEDTSTDYSNIREDKESRKSAFKLMSVIIRSFKNSTPSMSSSFVCEKIGSIASSYQQRMRYSWNHQIFYDLKRDGVDYAGLKNQGCTCYMNSLLQQLFMDVDFREAVLKTPLKEVHRSTLWHKSDAELVGCRFNFQWKNGTFQKGLIKAFDSIRRQHIIEYDDFPQTLNTPHYVDFRNAKMNEFETTLVKAYNDDDDQRSDEEIAASAILEQLQRTFCFLKCSKRRYFDPRPFVEVCKTLNLNFSVFQQNDAVEFYDKLLDRMEISMQGKSTGQNDWSNVVKVIGGKMLYSKIPKQCAAYESKKEECGHFQDSRSDKFLKIELIIRGKETIEESLGELVRSELMDGDNKINCDVCKEKKATTRATCFDELPNSFIIHLKRFDLDFETFETVKLNNRLSFPVTLNMYKFTRQAREEVGKDNVTAEGADIDGDNRGNEINAMVDDEDHKNQIRAAFDYELQGVLVHAGVAQGGHYYSFARDSAKWYKFDDDDVTPFDPENIADECFGGPSSSSSSSSGYGPKPASETSHDRTSNALMLFYRKKSALRTPEGELVTSSGIVEPPSKKLVLSDGDEDKRTQPGLIDGYGAFMREVTDFNIDHAISKQLLDAELHNFVLNLLQLANDTTYLDELNTQTTEEYVREITVFASSFFFNIVLHCRDRSEVQVWINEFKSLYSSHERLAVDFVASVLGAENSWFNEYLMGCNDDSARNSFVTFFVVTLQHCVSSADVGALTSIAVEDKVGKVSHETILVQEAIRKIVQALAYDLFKTPATSGGLLALLADLSKMAVFRKCFLELDTIEVLVSIVVPDRCNESVKQCLSAQKYAKHDLQTLQQSAVDTIAALLGAPQIVKVQLLDETTTGYSGHSYSHVQRKLTREAEQAFTVIFTEATSAARVQLMDLRLFAHLNEKVKAHSYTDATLNAEFEKYDKDKDGKWSLEEFLAFITESCTWSQTIAWKVLSYFDFKNDLSRQNAEDNENALSRVVSQLSMQVPLDSRNALADIYFYDCAYRCSESACTAILKKITINDADISTYLVREVLDKVYTGVQMKIYMRTNDMWVNLIKHMLSVDDAHEQLRLRELFLSPRGIAATMVDVLPHVQDLPQQHYPYNNSSMESHKYEYYFEVGRQLYGSMHRVAKWVDEEAANGNHELAVFRDKINPTGRKIPSKYSVDNLARSQVTVDGASGIGSACNGVYTFYKKSSGGGSSFQRLVEMEMPNGEKMTKRFMVYRCVMKNDFQHWFISSVPPGIEYGTSRDVDFYSIPSSYEPRCAAFTDDVYPPHEGWKAIHPSDEPDDVRVTWEIVEDGADE